MTSTLLFTPSDILMSGHTASLDLFELQALIDDHLQTWSHLLPLDSSSPSDTGLPSVWSRDKHDVPLLKPAIPKSFNSLDAKFILSLVEENLKEDALDDWEPFSGKDSAVSRASPITQTSWSAKVDPISNSIASLKSPVAEYGSGTTYTKVVLSPYHDEGIRLSTPHDWKPFHPLDPSSPFHERYDETPNKSFDDFILSDDCLISQGDAARARRKRGQRFIPEISKELIIRRDTVQIANLLRTRRFQLKGEPEGSVPELPPPPPPKDKPVFISR